MFEQKKQLLDVFNVTISIFRQLINGRVTTRPCQPPIMFRLLRRKNIKILYSLMLGALLMVVYLYKDTTDTKTKYFRRDVRKDVNSSVFSHPRCEQNVSADNITGFTSLSEEIQDFLYYRHCRHFPMILDLPDKCREADGPADIFLLLVIKSSPKNYDRREVLRKTWAKERLHKGVWIRTVFISGTAGTSFEKQRMNKLLQLEHQEHNDILQWDFKESFFNLTLKQMLFLEWMERNCPHARFLLNGDDDVFANTDNMVEYLQGLSNNNGGKHLFTGHLINYASPVRWRRSKYFIPVQVHESNSYPPYCGGGGYLLSGYTALVIYKVSKSIPIFAIDDVYMGMCLAEAKLAPESHNGVKTLGWYVPSSQVDKYDPCYIKELLLIHKFHPPHMYVMWNLVHDPNLKCGITEWIKETQNLTYMW